MNLLEDKVAHNMAPAHLSIGSDIISRLPPSQNSPYCESYRSAAGACPLVLYAPALPFGVNISFKFTTPQPMKNGPQAGVMQIATLARLLVVSPGLHLNETTLVFN